MSLLSLKKFLGPHLTRHDFHFVCSCSRREECWWDGAGSALEVQGPWIDVQQSREGPGNLWTPTPLADICSASSVWAGWFSFAPHLFPIKSYKTPIKMVTKQKFSQVQLDWNFLYQFCHLQRLPHTRWGGKCGWFILVVLEMLLSAALMKWELLSFQVALPWNNPTWAGRGGTTCCAQDFMLTFGPTLEMETLECLQIFIFTLSDLF